MKINIIQVGNSKGIRLPKTLIEEYDIGDSVELVLHKEYIELRPKKNPRENWASAFKEMAKDENEVMLLPDVFEDEDL